MLEYDFPWAQSKKQELSLVVNKSLAQEIEYCFKSILVHP